MRCCRGCTAFENSLWPWGCMPFCTWHCVALTAQINIMVWLHQVLRNFVSLSLPELTEVSIGEPSLPNNIPWESQKGKGSSPETNTAKSRLGTAPENGFYGVLCQWPCWGTWALSLSSFRRHSGRCCGWRAKNSNSLRANVGPFYVGLLSPCIYVFGVEVDLDMISFHFFCKTTSLAGGLYYFHI